MKYDPDLEPITVYRRGKIPTIKQTFSANSGDIAADQILQDCLDIIKSQTELARDEKSVQRVNERLDAANKAMKLASSIRRELPAVESAIIHEFICTVASRTELMRKADLYREYILYCDITGNQPFGKYKFYEEIEKFGVRTSHRGKGRITGTVAILPRIAQE
jgi:hypothetical protein